MTHYRIASPAKLNLFLHITGRRPDGYHELQSIFQLINLCDWLTFQLTPQPTITLTGLEQVNLSDNLIYRAAKQLEAHKTISQGIQIHIEKHIPMGAGLGGGSSNAATTLLILNQLWQCHLTTTQLAHYAAQLGADVPFFIYGKNAWVEGIGEQLEAIVLPQKRYIVLKPDCFISTQQLFSQKDLTRNSKKIKFNDYRNHAFQCGNNFEPIARCLYPQVDEAMRYLEQYNTAHLTGTGSCVFIEINDTFPIRQILDHAPCRAYLVESLQQSPVLSEVDKLNTV